MAKILKILGAVVAILVGLVVLAIIVLPMVVDPNDYKGVIADEVAKQTGRTLTIEGDIDLSVFPWLGLEIGPTQLSNAAGFKDQYMAQMEAVEVRVKLLPLLKKQLEVNTVRLTGLVLNLARDKNGKTNWEDLTGEAASTGKAAEQEPGGEAPAGGLASLAIGGIKVEDARLNWDDQAAGAHYEIADLALNTGTIEPESPFDLGLSFRVTAREPAVEGRFNLKGGVLLGAGMRVIDVTAASLELDANGDGVPGGHITLSLASDIHVDLDAQTLSLPNLMLETLGLKITGNVAGTAITADKPQFSGKLAVAEFKPRAVIDKLATVPIVTRDPNALAKAAATLDWTASPQDFTAKGLQMTLDDTRINGNASVNSFDAPAIRFALKVDSLDLDRYLPPAAEQPTGKPEEAAQAGGTGAQALPLEPLRKLNLDGKLEVGSLTAFNLHSSNIVVKVKAKDGLLQVNPLDADLYSGKSHGDITLNVRNDKPRFGINEKISGLQAEPLLQDLTGDALLAGTTELTANLEGAGTSPEAIKQTLNGSLSFAFTDGSVKGVNIAALIRKAQAKIKGQPAPPEESNQTDFSSLRGTAKVTNGLVRNDDLIAQSPLLRITGKGEASLPAENIDYTLTTKFVGSLEGQGGKGMDELKGVSIPVHVGGNFSKPTYTPDLGAALSEAAKAKVEEKVEEQKQKLQKKLGDKVQDKLLKGLFN